MKGDPLGPMIPQECGSFMTCSFQSSNPAMLSRVPDFYQWTRTNDATFRYQVHKMWLQQLGWKHPGKHWVLKIQEHMYKMRELRSVYPDAIFIQPHRDPATVVASISQLIRVIRAPADDEIDSHALGQELLYLWWDGVKAMIDYRKEHPDLPIYDMKFRDLVKSPVPTIKAAYEYFGWEFTPASAQGILHWLAENPLDKHGTRSYTLEEFGLDAEKIHGVFAEYTELYGAYF